MALRRWSFCVVCLNLAFMPSTAAQPEPRRVLLLSSFLRDPSVVFTQNFRTELSRQSPEPVNFFEVSIRATPFGPASGEEPVVDYVRATTTAVGGFDLVVSVAGTSAVFVEKYGERLFPTTPLIQASGDSRFMDDASASLNRTSVALVFDLPRLIDNILVLLPKTTTVFVVTGTSESEEFWRTEMVREFERFKDRLTFVWFNELSFTEILERSSALPPNSAIFYPSYAVDGKGVFHSEERALAQLHAVANAPIFAPYDYQLGHGIVGGSLTSMADLARDTADVAVRILHGESAGSIERAPQQTGTPTYDWRELQRWGISEARLPAGSIIQFRQPSVWNQYRFYILGTALILGLQSALIAGLVVQRVRRRRVEHSLRESEGALRESNQQNQDLAGRLITAQEVERARIARELHDDVCQRLAGLSIVLGGFRRRISESKPESDVDETLAMIQKTTSSLSNDVRHLSHELHSGVLQYAGLAAALKEHCSEFGRHHHLDITVDTIGSIGALDTDIALCLYRVTQEALTNTAHHARARVAQVRLARTSHGMELDVVDDGVGFDPEHHNGQGLGLRSISERVRFAKGSVSMESKPGHGTKLSVRIPLSTVPTDVVAAPASQSLSTFMEKRGRRPTVLIADDHPIVIDGLVALLKDRFDVVGTVSDGTRLLDDAIRLRPDIVVTDISMPGLDGLEVLRRLKAKGSDARVIVLTMHAGAELATEAMRHGAYGFLLKQSASDELVIAINEVLQGRNYLTPAVTRDVIARMAEGSPKPDAQLTPRQREVLRLITEGRRTKEIAALLNVSTRTVETHKYEMMQVLGVQTTVDLVRYALEHRLIVS